MYNAAACGIHDQGQLNDARSRGLEVARQALCGLRTHASHPHTIPAGCQRARRNNKDRRDDEGFGSAAHPCTRPLWKQPFLTPPTHPPTNQPTNPPAHMQVHLPTHPPTHQPNHPLTCKSTHPFPRSVHPPYSCALDALIKAKKPFIVTDAILLKLGALQGCIESLQAAGMPFDIFSEVQPNPTDVMCRRAYKLYMAAGCDSIIAFGGGSPMDCAKAVGAQASRPNKDIHDLEGALNVSCYGVWGTPPLLVAVPTTAGTGSEVTIGAVITFSEENRKGLIIDPALCPKVAFLDPGILTKLTPSITAATGMDALTHAVEAFLNTWRSPWSKTNSLRAIEKILGGRHLLTSYRDGANLDSRAAMLQAAFEAGVAITNAQVGYVHAIAHQFGGLYHTPHGEANAMVLPHVLDFYLRGEREGSTIIDAFAEMAQAAGLMSHYSDGNPTDTAAGAVALVTEIRSLLASMQMNVVVPKMKASDIANIARRALSEAHGEVIGGLANVLDLGYPVPKYMSIDECESLISNFLCADEKHIWAQGRSPRSKL